jgi:DNA polymerase-4
MAILREYGPVEQMSVDEAYLDLSSLERPADLPELIRQRVKEETGLPASVGLATSKLIAKIASDHDKPEGCTIVPPGEEAPFLAPLPVRVIWGIGPRTADRLASVGIHSCGDLAGCDLAMLEADFGRHASHMQKMALGIDERKVISNRGLPKSISQEWTFNEDVSDPAILKAQLRKQSASVARSLKKRHLIAHTVRVKFRWADFTTFTRQKSVEIGIDDEEGIYLLALSIWEANWPEGQKMRLLGVGVSGLEAPVARQIGFNF